MCNPSLCQRRLFPRNVEPKEGFPTPGRGGAQTGPHLQPWGGGAPEPPSLQARRIVCFRFASPERLINRFCAFSKLPVLLLKRDHPPSRTTRLR